MNMPFNRSTSIDAATVSSLRAHVPQTAEACVAAIVAQVPSYSRGSQSSLLATIASAVELALAAFLDSLEHSGASSAAPSDSVARMRTGAYRLGQGEAETGRSSDALLSAYRVGAREAWSQFAEVALRHGEGAPAIASLASDTFSFIDDLSAQSLAGHTAAMTTRTRELARRRDSLTSALVAGESVVTLEHLAERAHWDPPHTLTALILTGEASSALTRAAGERALWSRTADGRTLALVPDLVATRRSVLLEACGAAATALGPSLTWTEVSESVVRARRTLRFATDDRPADAELLLPELLLDADAVTSELLRHRAVEPLDDLSPAKRDVLSETVLTWLLHQGRRDDVAHALHVHPQTVRYRMNTARERYGERLTDPRGAFELTLGLLAARTRDEEEA